MPWMAASALQKVNPNMESKTVPPAPASNGGNGGAAFLEFEKPISQLYRNIEELQADQARTNRDHSKEIADQRELLMAMYKKIYCHLSPWETVQVARHPKRPLFPDYIRLMVKDFCELHGDRNFRDDRAIVTGFGRIDRQKVMIIGHSKGRDTKERLENHFGMAHPEGYRKALAKMKLAAKFRLPVVCLIDTAGAYPGVGAEERGIAQAIAVNLLEMARLPTPIVCVVVGEGGSGGALGIGVGDRIAMLEHAWYSVISPEGCAAILWKSSEYAAKASETLRLTSRDLKKLSLIDDVIREPMGGAHRDPEAAVAAVGHYVSETLRDLKRVKIDTLLKRRYRKLRDMASFHEDATSPAATGATTRTRRRMRTPATTPAASDAGRAPAALVAAAHADTARAASLGV